MQYKFLIFKALSMALIITLLVQPLYGQTPIGLGIMANPISLSNQTANLCLQWKGKSLLHQWGVCAGVQSQALRSQSPALVRDALSNGFNAEIRFYPFSTRVKKVAQTGCPAFNFRRIKKPDKLQLLAGGFYGAAGFAYSKADLAYYPAGLSINSTNLYAAAFRERTITTNLGYQVRFKFIALDISYGFNVSKPEINDPWKLLDPAFLSIAYPQRYRITQGFRLLVGLAF